MKFFARILLLFSLLSFQLKAQEFQVNIPHYSVVDYEYNKIQIPGNDSSQLNRFFHKWSELWALGTGKINILHIGGSHVQADLFSNQVRRNLDDKMNKDFQPPRGFIFPFNVAKTNNPTNYKVNYNGQWNAARNVQRNREIPLGMGGIAVYTQDPTAEINVSLNPDGRDRRWDFDELKLIGYNEDGMDFVRPLLKLNDTTFLEAVYDTAGKYYQYFLPQLTDSFTIVFQQTDSVPHTFILNGFLPEKDEEGLIYHAIGVNGASVTSYLNSENFEDELKLIAPDLVIFGIGINDATGKDFNEASFIGNYNHLIRIIKRVSPDCAFIFITNNDSFRRISRRNYRVNPNGSIARNAFYKLAEQNKGGVWDLFSLMGGLGSVQKWQQAGLAKADKIHFTQEGYVLIGNLFYNALMDYYEQNDIN
jgi:Lysophospholipase L1 and related esterases